MEGDNMDVWKDGVSRDINALQQGQTHLENDKRKIEKDIQDLQLTTKLQDKDIASLRDMFIDIKKDTGEIIKGMDEDKKEQLKQYKNFGWKVLAGIVGAAALIMFGLQ